MRLFRGARYHYYEHVSEAAVRQNVASLAPPHPRPAAAAAAAAPRAGAEAAVRAAASGGAEMGGGGAGGAAAAAATAATMPLALVQVSCVAVPCLSDVKRGNGFASCCSC